MTRMMKPSNRHGQILGCALAFSLWAAPAAAGDWQPFTGDDSAASGHTGGFVPRHWDVPSDIPIQPQRVHPQPAPSPTPAAGCTIGADSAQVRPGDYVTITITLPDPVAHQLGRVDLLFPDGPVAGLVSHGHSYQYTWSVPDTAQGSIPVRFVAFARSTGYAGQPRQLCAGSTTIRVVPGLRVQISGGNKVPVGVKRGLRADAKGGQEPLEFTWFVDGRHVGTQSGYMAAGGLAMLSHAYSPKGEHRVKVTVRDRAGETASDTANVTAYQCSLKVNGPSSVKVGDRGSWTVEIHDGYGRNDFVVEWGDRGKSLASDTSRLSVTVGHAYAKAGRYSLRATATDANKCEAQIVREITVVEAAQPAPSPAPAPSPGPTDGGTCRTRDECPTGQVCLMGSAGFGVCATPNF